MRATAFQLFAVTEGERLLDAGCGLGEVARHLGSVVGPRGSVVALDFPDGHVDGVRSERVLQHLADPARPLRNWCG